MSNKNNDLNEDGATNKVNPNDFIGLNEFARRKSVSLSAVQLAIKNERIHVDKMDGKRKLLHWPKQSANWDKNIGNRASTNDEQLEYTVGGASALTAARVKKENAVAKIKEMEARKLEGELIEINEVEKIIERAVVRARERLRNIPQKIAAELASENDPHYIEIKLLEEIDECLDNLKNIKP